MKKSSYRWIDPSHLNQEDWEKILNHYYGFISDDKNHEHLECFETMIKKS